MTQKIHHIDKKDFDNHKNYLLKNTFKVGFQYIFYVVKLFNTFIYLKLSFKLKIDLKTCSIKNLEEIYQKQVATLYTN